MKLNYKKMYKTQDEIRKLYSKLDAKAVPMYQRLKQAGRIIDKKGYEK